MSAAPVELLLPLAMAIPVVGAVLSTVLARFDRRLSSLVVVLATGLTLVVVIGLMPGVLAAGHLSMSFPALLTRAELLVDVFSLVFALVGTLVWFCASVHATAYLGKDPARERFQTVSLVVLAAYLGVVFAGDWMTLFVCFELLGLVALLLVLHEGTEKARRAGIKYFWMTLIAGFALLAGIVLVHAISGSAVIGPLPAEAASTSLAWAAFLLLLVGFGVKAGLVPLHNWLPDAHPAAPAPASALLSGVMIKAGAYGIFRLLNTVFRPEIGTDFDLNEWQFNARLGLLITWLGIVTMLVGVILALGQHHAKRMLAWHSVSQMGFVVTGLGIGAWLGANGAMGTAGGLLHMVNHALFKAGLFLGMGAVAFHAHSADMYKLGGLWRRMPVVFACMLIFAAGIGGVPLFNGFVSKSMIHHALVDGADLPGGASLAVAEWLFIATAVGTAASFVKLITLVFIRQPETQASDPPGSVGWGMVAPLLLLAIPVVLIGIQPQWLLQELVAPGLEGLALSADPIGRYLSVYYLGRSDVLLSAVIVGAGAAVFVIGMRQGWFHWSAPAWFGVDFWYRQGAVGFVRVCQTGSRKAGAIRDHLAGRAWRMLLNLDYLPGQSLKLSVAMIEALGRAMSGINRLLDRPGQWLVSLSIMLSAKSGRRALQDVLYRDLDQGRDELIAAAQSEANKRHGIADRLPHTDRILLEQRLEAARQVAGLVASQQLERAMATTPDDAAQHRAERTLPSARRLVDAADAWLDGQTLEKALESAGLEATEVFEYGPSLDDEHRWRRELRALLFRPGASHWPMTEHPDRSSLARRLRRLLDQGTTDPGAGLIGAVVLMVILLIGLLGN
jgi:formate hydrogenlyase subunit 3/multisubunit Na+/H+ antiporter MnhD subunit